MACRWMGDLTASLGEHGRAVDEFGKASAGVLAGVNGAIDGEAARSNAQSAESATGTYCSSTHRFQKRRIHWRFGV